MLAVAACVALTLKLRRVRTAQRAVLGDAGERDLVRHAAELQDQFKLLGDYVQTAAERGEQRLSDLERRVSTCISRRSLLRYDAYGEQSGHQSTTVALLDEVGCGLVLSSIVHREQARLYVRQVTAGGGDLQLSPEEVEAVRIAAPAPGA